MALSVLNKRLGRWFINQIYREYTEPRTGRNFSISSNRYFVYSAMLRLARWMRTSRRFRKWGKRLRRTWISTPLPVLVHVHTHTYKCTYMYTHTHTCNQETEARTTKGDTQWSRARKEECRASVRMLYFLEISQIYQGKYRFLFSWKYKIKTTTIPGW